MLGRRTGPHGMEAERLHFLTDGVYAIVLTLLVLEIKVPEGLSPEHLGHALVENIPKFIAFAIAFNASAIGWTYTYLSYGLMTRSHIGHVLCTVVSLLAVSLIPFTGAMMGAYPGSPWSMVAYCCNISFLTAAYVLDLTLAEPSLIPPEIDRRLIRVLQASLAGVSLLTLTFALLAFRSPPWALSLIGVVTLLIWIEYVLLGSWVSGEMAKVRAYRRAAHAED